MRELIFISYRREDASGEARSIYQELASVFPKHLFMDVDSITKGRDFGLALTDTLKRCSVMLVLVGQRWLDARDDSGKRKLDDPNDFVRLEIAAALKRNIPLIPVLIQGTKMPKADELPDDLKPLAMRQAAIITHENFSGDMDRFARDLEPLLPKFAFYITVMKVIVVALFVLIWFMWPAG
jgi:hypothetical protein